MSQAPAQVVRAACKPRRFAPPLSIRLRKLSRRRVLPHLSPECLLPGWSFCLRVSGAVTPSAPVSPKDGGPVSPSGRDQIRLAAGRWQARIHSVFVSLRLCAPPPPPSTAPKGCIPPAAPNLTCPVRLRRIGLRPCGPVYCAVQCNQDFAFGSRSWARSFCSFSRRGARARPCC